MTTSEIETKTNTCQRCLSPNAVISDGEFYSCICCGHVHGEVSDWRLNNDLNRSTARRKWSARR